MDEISVAQELLQSGKVSDRKKGIKQVQKNNIHELGDDLLILLNKELEKSKSWELIVSIIDTLGLLKYEISLPLLKKICKENKEMDMVTAAASKAYCRITRKDLTDVASVLEFLTFGKFAVVNGALKSVGIDRVVPSEKDQYDLITRINNAGFEREKGYSDVRMGLALACAGWKKNDIVKSFLEQCINSNYSPLQKVVENALRNKYISIE